MFFLASLASSYDPSWDLIEREIEEDNADENFLDENDYESEYKRELVKRADKSYLSAQK